MKFLFRRNTFLFILLITLICACQNRIPEDLSEVYDELNASISYNNDIRPILADRCFSCHGPDANARKADLRLDIREYALENLESGNGHAIVPGKVTKSTLLERILSQDQETVMPPPDSRLTLTDKEKALLFRWVEQGAVYEDHWAYLPPKATETSNIPENYTSYNKIDPFIIDELVKLDLPQSPLASKERLIRRVTMDITGLPPSIKEIDDYLNDNSENAYEKVVDRLLTSSAYGERMAMEWMDVARYADSHGMHADGFRLMWPWRDWVIKSFNENMSYKDFVTWQIGGDMFPNATEEQKLATAFNRNHTMTAEGGAIDEEFRLTYVFDRTETFSTVFLGMTAGCARCHDHKFDPLSQKEYYEMAAFFNNVKELGMTGDDGNYGPLLPILSPETKDKLTAISANIRETQESIQLSKKEVADINSFLKLQAQKAKENIKDRIFYGKIDVFKDRKLDNLKHFVSRSEHELVEGYKGKAVLLTGEYDELYITDTKTFQAYDPFSASLWINTTKSDSTKTQTLLGTAGEKNDFWRGWDFYLDEKNRLNVRLIHSLPHNYIHARSMESVDINSWVNAAFTYDGSAKASGINLYIDGQQCEMNIQFDQLYKSIHPVSVGKHILMESKPIKVGKSYRSFTGEYGVFLGRIDEIKIYNQELSYLEVKQIFDPEVEITNKGLLQEHLFAKSPNVVAKKKVLREQLKEKLEIYDHVEEVMVMAESPEPRPSYMYNRGEYTQATERVYATTPAVLPKFSDSLPKNRLGLAQWLFSEDHPLTARVTVNRYWQMIFGNGIVASANDFGLQGSRPTHPKLLDNLALAFMENEWDLKWLVKEMVMSYTYQQSSDSNELLRDKDPANQLLAKGPSYRLQAEMIRDNALAASGVLVREEGGESVKPYQPDGLWIEKSSFSHILLNYHQDNGDSLYRRSLYTFLRRTSPPPSMTIFDAPNREVCTIKRENTSTPLQALVLLNDPQFVEAARILAERIQEEGGQTLEDKIAYAFRLTTSRKPKAEEVKLLTELYEKQLAYYIANKAEAKKLISVGDFRVPDHLKEGETAALTSVASTIINHNEAYMKR